MLDVGWNRFANARTAMFGALEPEAGDGVVVVQDPTNDPLHMTPDETDISRIRLLDAADKARRRRVGKG